MGTKTAVARPISAAYRIYESAKTACILGAAPGLMSELEQRPPKRGDLVFALNSAFLAYPDCHIHLVANREFLALYGAKLTRKRACLRPNSFEAQGYEDEYYYYPSKKFEIEYDRIPERDESLLASQSVLVPALHFVLRCNPRHVILYGVDLRHGRHWDDGINENASAPRFRGRKIVTKHLQLLRAMFPQTKIFCMNRQSVLVTKKVIQPWKPNV